MLTFHMDMVPGIGQAPSMFPLFLSALHLVLGQVWDLKTTSRNVQNISSFSFTHCLISINHPRLENRLLWPLFHMKEFLSSTICTFKIYYWTHCVVDWFSDGIIINNNIPSAAWSHFFTTTSRCLNFLKNPVLNPLLFDLPAGWLALKWKFKCWTINVTGIQL